MFKVSKIKFNHPASPTAQRNNLKNTISKAVEAIGGFSKFVKKGEVVLLKPNFNTADPFPASTDIKFLEAVINLVYDRGAKLVIVADSSTYYQNTRKVMEEKGIFDLQKRARPPKVYSFDEREWITKDIPKAKYLKRICVPKLLNQVDKLILLPCLKTHFATQFTGSLKLSVGFMKPRERVWMHMKNIQEKIAELNTIIHPDLVIMDARKCFITGGPMKGKRKQPNLILASDDRIACDVEGIKIIQSYPDSDLEGIDPWKLTQIKKAVELGIGVKDEKDYKIITK